jgi:hypothetical protein
MKAFPWTGVGTEGMDLRDYFAAKALAAIIQRNTGHVNSWHEMAYKMADAMMEARQTPNNVRENTNG